MYGNKKNLNLKKSVGKKYAKKNRALSFFGYFERGYINFKNFY